MSRVLSETESRPRYAQYDEEAGFVPGYASIVAFRPYTVHRETRHDPLLGCRDAGLFLEVDEDGVLAAELLAQGWPIEAVEEHFETKVGQAVDVAAFVLLLANRGFVAKIDDVLIPLPEGTGHATHGHQPLEGLQWLRSDAIVAGVAGIFLAWLTAVTLEPSVLPRPSDLRIGVRPLSMLMLAFAGTLLMAYLHELAHFFMARAYGIPARIRARQRYALLVLETDVTWAWTLPRKQRLKIFLAGIAFNLTAIGILGLILYADQAGILALSAQGESAVRYVSFLNVFPVLLQLFIFGRTDLYYVIGTIARQRNLATDARKATQTWLAGMWQRMSGGGASTCSACGLMLPSRDDTCQRCGSKGPQPNALPAQRNVIIFGVAMGAGQALAYGLVAFIVGRLSLIFFLFGVDHLIAGLNQDDWILLIESILFMALVGLQVAMLASFLLRPFATLGQFLFTRGSSRQRLDQPSNVPNFRESD